MSGLMGLGHIQAGQRRTWLTGTQGVGGGLAGLDTEGSVSPGGPAAHLERGEALHAVLLRERLPALGGVHRHDLDDVHGCVACVNKRRGEEVFPSAGSQGSP